MGAMKRLRSLQESVLDLCALMDVVGEDAPMTEAELHGAFGDYFTTTSVNLGAARVGVCRDWPGGDGYYNLRYAMYRAEHRVREARTAARRRANGELT